MTKIYTVTRDDGSQFLVEATTRVTALHHIARESHKVELANQKDLVAAIRAGVEIHVAAKPEAAAAK